MICEIKELKTQLLAKQIQNSATTPCNCITETLLEAHSFPWILGMDLLQIKLSHQQKSGCAIKWTFCSIHYTQGFCSNPNRDIWHIWNWYSCQNRCLETEQLPQPSWVNGEDFVWWHGAYYNLGVKHYIKSAVVQYFGWELTEIIACRLGDSPCKLCCHCNKVWHCQLTFKQTLTIMMAFIQFSSLIIFNCLLTENKEFQS